MNKFVFLIFLFTQVAEAQIDLSFGLSFIKPATTASLQPIPLRPHVNERGLATPSDKSRNLLKIDQPAYLPVPLLIQTEKIARLLSPPLFKVPSVRISAVSKGPILAATEQLAPLTVRPQVDELVRPTELPGLQNIEELTADEYKLLLAEIFLNVQKKPLPALILSSELLQSPHYKDRAAVIYARAALTFKLNQEFRYYITSSLPQLHPAMQKSVLQLIMQNADLLTAEDIKKVDPLVQQHQINMSSWYTYRKAQYLENESRVYDAQLLLKNTPRNAENYMQSRLFLTNLLYRNGQLSEAIQLLESAQTDVPKENRNKLRHLYYLTLARLYFQKARYDLSYKMYLQIDRTSPLWLSASSEQALAQTLSGDDVGAAGNMFSLHTEYFKNAFAPQSYIVRAASYLNLCQYGDAITVITELDRRYTNTQKQLDLFSQNNPEPESYYKLVQSALNTNNSAIDLPRSFIYEMARAPRFLYLQKLLNAMEDEMAAFNRLSIKINSDSAQLQSRIKQLRLDRSIYKEQRLLALETETGILQSGEKRLSERRFSNKRRLDQLKEKYRPQAALALKQQFEKHRSDLKEILAQKELLAYEIYSGAGEHLRAQSAGAEIKNRNPAEELKPEDRKSYRWNYRGELWEDEIGHYRSSLVNVCAKTQ